MTSSLSSRQVECKLTYSQLESLFVIAWLSRSRDISTARGADSNCSIWIRPWKFGICSTSECAIPFKEQSSDFILNKRNLGGCIPKSVRLVTGEARVDVQRTLSCPPGSAGIDETVDVREWCPPQPKQSAWPNLPRKSGVTSRSFQGPGQKLPIHGCQRSGREMQLHDEDLTNA